MSKFLDGHLLIATPAITDERFIKSVIFLCSHDYDHAMGLIINKINPQINFNNICEQMNIKDPRFNKERLIHIGGPMDNSRGFVLHTSDHILPETKIIGQDFGMTCSVDIIKELASGGGPEKSIVTVGYAGWYAGQLEVELKQNSWLTINAQKDIVFNSEIDDLWNYALSTLGISPSQLSGNFGSA